MDWKKFDNSRGIFLVNLLGIVYDYKTKKILIGLRENDPHIKQLSWCFPGGRPGYEDDLEKYLILEVKKKTNIKINVKKVIFAKTYPEERHFLSIYYLCERISGKEKPGEKFKEIKWIYPKDIKKYFTTSIHPELFNILKKM